jgi:hypothetical protein
VSSPSSCSVGLEWYLMYSSLISFSSGNSDVSLSVIDSTLSSKLSLFRAFGRFIVQILENAWRGKLFDVDFRDNLACCPSSVNS